jgi:hypothetical protein
VAALLKYDFAWLLPLIDLESADRYQLLPDLERVLHKEPQFFEVLSLTIYCGCQLLVV